MIALCAHAHLGATLPKFIGPRQACSLCKGTAGRLLEGAHALCRARANRGGATPSMGDFCPCCGGAQCHPRSAVGPIDPNQAMIERWAPTCQTCKGTGAIAAAGAP